MTEQDDYQPHPSHRTVEPKFTFEDWIKEVKRYKVLLSNGITLPELAKMNRLSWRQAKDLFAEIGLRHE